MQTSTVLAIGGSKPSKVMFYSVKAIPTTNCINVYACINISIDYY